ncbi:PH domain-containing protein [Flavimobilis sp. GY10621]|uniref:PH domain-containing protein n=1 Tax=Flavimobilis rhizosphaerae TaxID=2775421 RepID=A0ABR9DMF5_9MICO|nr:PH domain-containing protein [Flavimobilis rhizosphaerae]MBD9698084.1 PH domain-containing protein [Flavimobilis rhizosphaerae]
MTTEPSPFDLPGITWQRVSPRLVPARQIAVALTLVVPLLVGVVLAVLVHPAFWVLAGVVAVLWAWIAIVVVRQVRAIGYVEREDDLLIRKGVMFRNLVVVPYGRMQYVEETQGPLARIFGIKSLQLHTAAATTDASIDGLDPAEAARLRDRLASRGEARLAGL